MLQQRCSYIPSLHDVYYDANNDDDLNDIRVMNAEYVRQQVVDKRCWCLAIGLREKVKKDKQDPERSTQPNPQRECRCNLLLQRRLLVFNFNLSRLGRHSKAPDNLIRG